MEGKPATGKAANPSSPGAAFSGEQGCLKDRHHDLGRVIQENERATDMMGGHEGLIKQSVSLGVLWELHGFDGSAELRVIDYCRRTVSAPRRKEQWGSWKPGNDLLRVFYFQIQCSALTPFWYFVD